jgi:hypothetical protein
VFEREDETIEVVARELRRPVRLGDGVTAEVMRRVSSEARGAGREPGAATLVRRVARWAVRPRTVRVSPLHAAAALAAAVLLAVALRGTPRAPVQVAARPNVQAIPAAAAARSSQLVQFVLVAPAARQVSLVGDFNDWQVGSAPLRAVPAAGVWTIEVPLAPGRHRYAFVVDGGQWLPDPAAPRAAGDDFGTPSSVVTVVGQGA